MNVEDFTLLAKMVKDRSGLTLTREKAYLVESRLLPVARKWHLKTLDELAARLRAKQEQPLIRDIVEAMTTNESFFFRDIKPFDQFRQVVLPYLLQTRAATKTIKIWSAACSSGQEPYTLAMILREERHRLHGWHVDILATDLSTEILSKAQAGLYSQFEVQRGLPIQMLVKYFKQTGDRWQIDPGLREQVRYRPFNLLDEMAGLGVFDVVFCRNVLIYLDQPTKQSVLERIAKQLTPDGFLYLGGAETVVGITDKFQPMANHRGLYHQAIAGAARVAAL
jgi:chemotaxis protein methyltransferase CheR